MDRPQEPSSPRDAAVRYQLLYCLRGGPLGRRTLSRHTGLTEMTVRTSLERMEVDRWVAPSRRGVKIRPGAAAAMKDLESIREIVELPLAMTGDLPVQIAARLASRTSPPAWRLRDLAVAHGASILLLLHADGGEWCFSHDREPVALRNPDDADRLRTVFADPAGGDVVTCVGGSRRGETGCALWVALLALLGIVAWDGVDGAKTPG
ncbi:MAG: hypothetical protein JSW65_04405 [Candidatus Bipolaricaulota bacterium]|nr:MAG: hypothetical protein JSW65_04405 [Candidatus Bipolaricaulota bacterium]